MVSKSPFNTPSWKTYWCVPILGYIVRKGNGSSQCVKWPKEHKFEMVPKEVGGILSLNDYLILLIIY